MIYYFSGGNSNDAMERKVIAFCAHLIYALKLTIGSIYHHNKSPDKGSPLFQVDF